MSLHDLNPEDIRARRRLLRRSGIWAICSGLLLAIGGLIASALLSANSVVSRDTGSALGWTFRILGIIIVGLGMADLAERKGRPRSFGILAIFAPLSLIVLTAIPDDFRAVDENARNHVEN